MTTNKAMSSTKVRKSPPPGSFSYILKHKHLLKAKPAYEKIIDDLKVKNYQVKNGKESVTIVFSYLWGSGQRLENEPAEGYLGYATFNLDMNEQLNDDWYLKTYETFEDRYDVHKYTNPYNKQYRRYAYDYQEYKYDENNSTVFLSLEEILDNLRIIAKYVTQRQRYIEKQASVFVANQLGLPEEMGREIGKFTYGEKLGGRKTKKSRKRKTRKTRNARKTRKTYKQK